MSQRSDYHARLAAGEDVSGHPGRPQGQDDATRTTGPPVQVMRLCCTQCSLERLGPPPVLTLYHCTKWHYDGEGPIGWTVGVWARVP
jgi:hypothetical protein